MTTKKSGRSEVAAAVDEQILKRATSISAEERGYLAYVFGRKQQGEQMIVQGQRMISAYQEHAVYLATRYGLGPKDNIDSDGQIRREDPGPRTSGGIHIPILTPLPQNLDEISPAAPAAKNGHGGTKV